MNLKSATKICLLGSVLLACMSYCTQPTTEKSDETQLEAIAEQPNGIEALEDNRVLKVDSMGSVQNYMDISNDRTEENRKNLRQINNEIKSEKSERKLAFEGEIFQLNKKNLELQAQTADSLNYQGVSWEDFKANLNNELDMLEASIAELKVRIEKN